MPEPAKILGEPINEEVDPAAVVDAAFEPSRAALLAGAQRELIRAGIRDASPEQMKAAISSARQLYIASAKQAVRP
jgi:hypothetical protein